MQRLKRAAAVILSIVLVVGGVVGVAAYRRWQQVVTERSESKTRAATLRAKEALTVDEACWVVKDWYHHGEGHGGFRRRSSARGPSSSSPGASS